MTNSAPQEYIVQARYLVAGQGWQQDDTPVLCTYEEAGQVASVVARGLDAKYGDDHFWTVDLVNPRHPEYGSYYQLFHGRLQ